MESSSKYPGATTTSTFVCRREGIDRQPGQGRWAIDEDVVVMILDLVELTFEASLSVVQGRCKLYIGLRQQYVRWNDEEVFDLRLMDGQRFAIKDGCVDRLLRGDALILRKKHLTAVCLGVDIYEENSLVLFCQSGCEGYA